MKNKKEENRGAGRKIPPNKFLDTVTQVVIYRHHTASFCWGLQPLLGGLKPD